MLAGKLGEEFGRCIAAGQHHLRVRNKNHFSQGDNLGERTLEAKSSLVEDWRDWVTCAILVHVTREIGVSHNESLSRQAQI